MYMVTIQVNDRKEAQKLRDRLYLSEVLTDDEMSNLGYEEGVQK